MTQKINKTVKIIPEMIKNSILICSLATSYVLISLFFVTPSINAQLSQDFSPYLNRVQFKATHNSYRLSDPPQIQLDNYNVWEIELDFGLTKGNDTFFVGLNGPEKHHGLYTLKDWIRNITQAKQNQKHPIIIKLEAKTSSPCSPKSSKSFICADKWPKNWQDSLEARLTSWLGEEKIFTRTIFDEKYHSYWIGIASMSGKYIITLQDNSGNEKITDNLEFFFIDSLPFIKSSEKLIDNPSDFGRAIRAGVNRLRMDDGYLQPWSNEMIHPPSPPKIDSNHVGFYWGTEINPYQSKVQARTAYTLAKIHTLSHTPAKPPGVFRRMKDYSVTLFLKDIENAGTIDQLVVKLHGQDYLSTWELALENPTTYLERGAIETFWIKGKDVWIPQQITLKVIGVDDIALEKIVVVSQDLGCFEAKINGWIGEDHKNPMTFDLTPCISSKD